MKKAPSYPKITAKTNITVTQTQNININSPKAFGLGKKMFKNDHKKIRDYPINIHSNSSGNLLKEEGKKNSQIKRKPSKKISKVDDEQKELKKSKSKQELVFLSEKLKKLEDKIKLIKEQEKKQKQKSQISLRTTSKKKCSSGSKNKQIKITSAPRDLRKFENQTKNNKILKKAYSQKLAIRISPSQKKQDNMLVPTPKYLEKKRRKTSKQSRQSKQEALLHEFVTQVPNKHSMNLKESVEKSLRKKTFEFESENESSYSMSAYSEMYYIQTAVKSLTKPALFAIRQHLTQSIQTLQFLQNIRKPSSKEIDKQAITLGPQKFPLTIVLDLDETLIHCNQSLNIPHDVSLSIRFPTGEKIDAGVNIRPYATKFLQQLSKFCEVVVFTASHQCYANVVLNCLDPKKQFISHRLFRQHCWQTQEGIYIKDLRVLKNRNIENVLLVDNAAYSYFYQMDNGIPIIPFYDDKSDHQLFTLLEYIKQVIAASKQKKRSIKNINSDYFKLQKYAKFQQLNSLVETLYSKQCKNRK